MHNAGYGVESTCIPHRIPSSQQNALTVYRYSPMSNNSHLFAGEQKWLSAVSRWLSAKPYHVDHGNASRRRSFPAGFIAILIPKMFCYWVIVVRVMICWACTTNKSEMQWFCIGQRREEDEGERKGKQHERDGWWFKGNLDRKKKRWKGEAKSCGCAKERRKTSECRGQVFGQENKACVINISFNSVACIMRSNKSPWDCHWLPPTQHVAFFLKKAKSQVKLCLSNGNTPALYGCPAYEHS